MTKRKNPSAGEATMVPIPKGKRAGDHFTHAGHRYVVVSFQAPGGSRIRYARRLPKRSTAGKHTAMKRKNPRTIELKDLRKILKPLGYKVKTKSYSFGTTGEIMRISDGE